MEDTEDVILNGVEGYGEVGFRVHLVLRAFYCRQTSSIVNLRIQGLSHISVENSHFL
jgi:hypothetical protein